MRKTIVIILAVLLVSCSKNIEVSVPNYTSQLAIEMYLEDMTTLKCLVSETLPYSSDTINTTIDNATVIFSDGVSVDTLFPGPTYDYESGRHYNYASSHLFVGDSSKTYSLKVVDSLGRTVTATTGVPPVTVGIDSVIYSDGHSADEERSVSLSFTDPAATANYYRVIIGKGIDNYTASNTDVLLSDMVFAGKRYSVSSKAGYRLGDTVVVRLYTLLKDHYDFLQSIEGAKVATYNPFVQAVRAESNITGGQGIFTAIRYDERTIVLR